MKIAVIGMGAVGSILVSFLKQSNHEIIICDNRRERLNRTLKEGLRVVGNGKGTKSSRIVYPDAGVTNAADLKQFDPDLICVSVKTPFNKLIIKDLKAGGLEDHNLCIVQNGLDNEQQFANAFGPEHILRMVVNFGGRKSSPRYTQMGFFKPPNYLGYLDEQAKDVALEFGKALTGAGLTTQVVDNIRYYTWEKCILNSCLGTICAIVGKKMQDFLRRESPLTMYVMRECIEVAKLDGVEFPTDFQETSMEFLKNAGNHKPSILVDIENGYKTEIDWMNGRIAYLAQQHGSLAPLNTMVWRIVSMLEGEEISIDDVEDPTRELTMADMSVITADSIN